MIEVQVGEQDVQLGRPLGLHGHAEGSQTGSRVEDERVTARQADLDARRVAAVTDRVGARGGHRPATAPDAGAHQTPSRSPATSQKTATTPCISSSVAKRGYAVAWYARRVPS